MNLKKKKKKIEKRGDYHIVYEFNSWIAKTVNLVKVAD